METPAVHPRGAKFTDEQLREDLANGLKPSQIADKYEVTRPAVSKRIKRLRLATTSAAVAPAESERFVRRTIDAIEELVDALDHVKLLRDACHDWLEDPDEPGTYNLAPRADEVMITYSVVTGYSERRGPIIERRKKPLSELLNLLRRIEDEEVLQDVERSEWRHADPRELILKTCSEARQIVGAAADLARFLAEAKRMEEFREEMLAAVAEASPEVRDAIVQRLRSRLVLHAAVRGPESLPA